MTPPHQSDPGTQAGLPACVRHPDRLTGLSCTRCGRPACPECLVEASVGFHCVDCVNAGRQVRLQPTTVAGARLESKPVLVPALIAINVVVFVITALVAKDPINNDSSTLFHELSEFPPLVADGEWWRVLTSGFLHFGPIHLAVNMVALWFLRDMELLLGRGRFAIVYLLSLLGGSAAPYVFGDLRVEGAGASGAIYGLLGGLIVAVLRLKQDKHALMNVFGVLAVNLAISVTVPGVSLLAHLGGLAVGAAVTFGMIYAPPQQRRTWQVSTVVLVTAALIGLYAVRTAQILDWLYPV
ncbi:rhomboid family intramembrane serine protease [Actinokineospora cianjurensis]|uniref:Membrane associated rhomboid family serine protease n=1 Tax=Actinokineospora cianjurensis TaxID=585224 RepID=A0A421B7D0_9PSEU|nr:rhomboid family intramembrane serine protease [Actinokineospora cianjurensis]RLK60185.1 membrane associated rhomboid family serine protease [Actinokineospora cianjurensis]